jgi:hypothetical protein
MEKLLSTEAAMSQLYRHSNKFTPQGLLAGVLAGVVVAIPLSFLYVYATSSIPSAKLRALCPIVYGLLVGAGCGLGLCWGKVRNSALAGVVGMGASVSALYLSWAIWIMHLMSPSFWIFNPIRAALQPKVLWKVIVALNAEGTWSMKGSSPVTGAWLWAVWAGEAVLLLGFGALAAAGMVMRRPFCERCEAWCSEGTNLWFAAVPLPAEMKRRVEAEDIGWITTLTRGNKKEANYRLDLHTCGNCHALNTLSLAQNFPKDRKTLVDKLLVSEDHAAAIRNLKMTHELESKAPVAALSPSVK